MCYVICIDTVSSAQTRGYGYQTRWYGALRGKAGDGSREMAATVGGVDALTVVEDVGSDEAVCSWLSCLPSLVKAP